MIQRVRKKNVRRVRRFGERYPVVVKIVEVNARALVLRSIYRESAFTFLFSYGISQPDKKSALHRVIKQFYEYPSAVTRFTNLLNGIYIHIYIDNDTKQ